MNHSVVAEIPDSLLFRYRIPCRPWTSGERKPVELPTSCGIPVFSERDLPGAKPFAQLRVAWSAEGLYIWMKVKGKKKSLWCRNTQMLESDGLQIWISSREAPDMHRANRFCHWFVLLPLGNGSGGKQPLASMLKINRAKEDSPAINQAKIGVHSEVQKTGYQLAAFLPAGAINGWDPADHRLIGFHYLVNDRELGSQSLGVGPDYPMAEDPSLWSSLLLNDD